MSQKLWIGDPEPVLFQKRRFGRAKIRILSIIFGIGFLLVLGIDAKAQEPLSDPDAAPPPIKVLSKEEKQALDAETEVRKHTSVALELMSKRLSNAEAFNSAERFEDMYKELGSFHALMDNALEFLTKKDTDSAKVLNNFKKLEIGLRTFQPRLETIRRDLSLRYEPYIRTLIRYIHEAREKAIAPMFGDTVIRDKPKS